MRTHIILALVALISTACASKENLSQAQQERQEERQEMQAQSTFLHTEGAASTIR